MRAIFCFLAVVTAILISVPALCQPTIWFVPLDPLQRPEAGYGGSPQYMELFSADAPWQRAASHVDVYKIYPQWISQASDADLRVQFADLKRRGIKLALEAGAMTSPGTCGKGVEGYGGQSLLNMVKRIHQDGETLSYIAMDEPIYFGSLYTGHDACHWTPEQAVAASASNLKAVLAAFPEVKIGDIEPVSGTPTPTMLDHYRRGMEAFQRALGVPLAFFHADIGWWLPEFPANLVAVHAMVETEHVPFGVIYNGNPDDLSDAAWVQSAEIHMMKAEQAIGTPEQVIFQSWHRYPRKLLPETDPDSFTHLINAYFRTRTKLTIAAFGRDLGGRLMSSQGEPVPGAKIEVQLTPLSPGGTMGTFTARGGIPAGTTNIIFGMRVNEECGCSGPADVRVAELRFQPQDGPALARAFPNPQSMAAWGEMTDSKGARVAWVEDGLLHLVARRDQQVMINSAPMPLSGQGDSTFSVRARVTPSSTGSGYFAVFFMQGGRELSRTMIPFAPASLPAETAVTKADGSWTARAPEQRGDIFTATAQYAGNEKYWPAQGGMTKKNGEEGKK